MKPEPQDPARALDVLLERVRGLLAEIYAGPELLATELVRSRRQVLAQGRELRADDLAGLKPFIVEQLAARPAADGLGLLSAPGLVPGRERYVEWWHRSVSGVRQLPLNLDPTSVDVYDYFEMDWYRAARDHGSRAAFGPYVDYSGADHYICTFTLPVVDDGTFLCVAGTDWRMGDLEPRLLALLRGVGRDAVLIGSERQVVAANCARWLVGSRLRRLPRTGEDGFLAVGEVGLDSGWKLALAAPE